MVLNNEELYLPYYFNVTNGVKQRGVISPILFSCYIDKLFSQLAIRAFWSLMSCRRIVCGAFGYADDIALFVPSLQSLRKIISIYHEQYAKTHSITFNPNKSKLLCYNVDEAVDIPPFSLNGEVIPSVGSDQHLGNYISTDIADRNIVDSVYDLCQRSNWVISDFRVCDSNYLR